MEMTENNPGGQLDMNARLIYWYLSQGLGVVVLGIFCYVTYKSNQDVMKQLQSCQSEKIEILQKQNAAVVELLTEIRDAMANQGPTYQIPVVRKPTRVKIQ